MAIEVFPVLVRLEATIQNHVVGLFWITLAQSTKVLSVAASLSLSSHKLLNNYRRDPVFISIKLPSLG